MSLWPPPINAQIQPELPDGSNRANAPSGVGPGVSGGFGQILAQVSDKGRSVTVQKGDTLVGIVVQQYKTQGLAIDGRRAYREALQLAKNNGIANANVIAPGDQIQWVPSTSMDTQVLSTLDALKQKAPVKDTPIPRAEGSIKSGSSSLLDQTLQRAVEKGYVPASEVEKAKTKIHGLSEKYGFEPDHFAMLTLMESDGMNPQATNGRCHGIIQFCEGTGKGAASVGMAGQAKQILGMGLIKQLDLVDKYFQDIGLESSGKKMGLDDLYLSVLTPSARQETRRQSPLAIPGRQALDLYAQGSVNRGITRDSLVHGLMNVARKIFPDWQPNVGISTQVARNDKFTDR